MAAAALHWEGSFDFKETTKREDFGVYSRLSAKSLELCTENLGSESGNDIAGDEISVFGSVSSFPSEQKDDQVKMETKRKPKTVELQTKNTSSRFPPPLTTMSGTSSLQVRRHRDGGRLIIEAVETPFRSSYLQAERSDGRLRLCYMTDSDCESVEEEEDFEHPRNEIEADKEDNMERFQRLSRCKERRHENEGLCITWKPVFWPVATS